MQRLTAADFDQELLILFDAYVHGDIDRRGFLERARRFAVGGLTAAGLLAALSPDFARAQVAPDAPGLRIETITIDSPQGYGSLPGYLCRPAQASGPLPRLTLLSTSQPEGLSDVAQRWLGSATPAALWTC